MQEKESNMIRLEHFLFQSMPLLRRTKQRAKQNFYITGKQLHPDLIVSLVRVKKAAAMTNFETGELNKIADAIIAACNDVIQENTTISSSLIPFGEAREPPQYERQRGSVANIAIEKRRYKGRLQHCPPQ